MGQVWYSTQELGPGDSPTFSALTLSGGYTQSGSPWQVIDGVTYLGYIDADFAAYSDVGTKVYFLTAEEFILGTDSIGSVGGVAGETCAIAVGNQSPTNGLWVFGGEASAGIANGFLSSCFLTPSTNNGALFKGEYSAKSGATTGNIFGMYLQPTAEGGGTCDNAYSFYASDAGSSAATTNYAFYSNGGYDYALYASSGDIAIAEAGKGLRVKTGSNARIGQATLVGGTVTVSNTSVTANTRIFVTVSTAGGTQGHLSTSKVANTSFTITSTSGTETSTVDWFLVESIA
jgi:hypothetical protein